jgi:hypothetical protein
MRTVINQFATEPDARDVARAITETPEYERSRHRRKKVEMLLRI